MKPNASRRNFLAAGLALPAAGLATVSGNSSTPAPAAPKSAPGELRYRTLGKTGLKVTEVAFGCMITSDPSVIEKAADLGINHFDTARGYQSGNNERMVGAALKGRRNKIILSSKTPSPTKERALQDLDTSLRELGTDHLDIWYLHAKSKPEHVSDELMEAQNIAKQQGKIRFAGISTHSGHKELIPRVLETKHFDVVLTSYNFTMDAEFSKIVASIANAGLGVVGMKVMAGGYRRVKPGDKLYDTFQKEGTMLSALKWVLKDKNVHTTIPSMTDMDQLDENLKAMAGPFNKTDEKILAAQLDVIKPVYCRMCGECSGVCPKGLPVSDVLRYLTYAEGYGQFGLGRENFLALPAEVAEVRCADCSTCPIECRNGVKVVDRLIRAQELFA